MTGAVVLQVRCEDEWLARVGAAADEMGLSVSAYVRAAVNAAMEGRLWQTVGGGREVALGLDPVRPARRVPRQPDVPESPTASAVTSAVHAAAAVVNVPVTRQTRGYTDPRAGCTHPPASVRTRGGIRSCGNCGTDLGLAKGG